MCCFSFSASASRKLNTNIFSFGDFYSRFFQVIFILETGIQDAILLNEQLHKQVQDKRIKVQDL